VRNKPQDVTYYGRSDLAIPLGRTAQRQVGDELARGVLATSRAAVNGDIARARIGELEWTAHTAVNGVVSLSSTEVRVAQTLPHALPRVQAVVDAYTYLALDELRHLGRR
jgi:hypothetical protein